MASAEDEPLRWTKRGTVATIVQFFLLVAYLISLSEAGFSEMIQDKSFLLIQNYLRSFLEIA